MADLSDYANQLLMQYMTPEKPNFAEGDPYAQFSSVLSPINQVITNGGDFGTGERVTAALLSGLLGGGLDTLSNNLQSGRKKAYFDIALGKGDGSEADLLSPDLFSSAEQANSIFKLAEAEKAKAATAAREGEIFKSMLENPYRTKKALEMIGQSAVQKEAAPIGKLPETPTSGEQPIAVKPLSLTDEYDKFMNLTGGNETLSNKMVERALDKDKEGFQMADSLRKELASNKQITEFADIKNKLQVLALAAADPRSSADLDYIYGIAKILDPAAVVRESDAGMVIDSQSIPASTLGYINKLARGESALDRSALFDLARRHYDTRKEGVSSLLDRYSALAKKRNLDPIDILPFTKDSLSLSLPTALTKPIEGNVNSGGDSLIPSLQLILQKVQAKAPLTDNEKATLEKARKQVKK